MRHAHTASSKQFNGHDDSPLDEIGIRQAEEKREQNFKLSHFDFVTCGTKQRHYQTAEILTNGKCPIVQDKRLDEINCGKFEGLQRNLALELAFLASTRTGTFDVETWEDLLKRTDNIYGDILREHPEQDGLVVTSTMNVTAFKKLSELRIMMTDDNGVKSRVKNCDYITIMRPKPWKAEDIIPSGLLQQNF